MKKLFIISLLCMMIGVSVISCQSGEQIEYTRYYTGGKLLYQARCQNCHGNNGEGLSALMPPLTDTAYIKQNIHRIPCFVQNGASGLISVSGKMYDGKMPPSGLSPIEIAKVLTYVGNSFGNKRGLISIETVTADLKKCQ